MLASYDELRKIDVTPFCEERDGMKYLNWSKCVDLLHQHGASKVYFVPVQSDNGSSLYMTDKLFTDSKGTPNQCYETRIEIHIDDDVYIMQSPVMNGANPVKDNSMSQQRVWNSMTRSFVKGVAIYTGLGFDLWLKEIEKYINSNRTNVYAEEALNEVLKYMNLNYFDYPDYYCKEIDTLQDLQDVNQEIIRYDENEAN